MATTIRSIIPASLNIADIFKKETPVIYNPTRTLTPSQELEILSQAKRKALVEDWDGAKTSDISDKTRALQAEIDANPYVKPIINPYEDLGTPTNFYNLYGTFLSNSLQSFHGISLNDIWLIDIDFNGKNKLLDNIWEVIVNYESELMGSVMNMPDILTGATNNSHLLLAQGVSVVGDSGTINRVGTTNTGYIQGNVGAGRTPFNTLDLKILENNTSFVDFILRPWMVAVSHASLKESKLKTDITIYALSRQNGFGNSGFIPRKIFNYYDCVPIDVDNMEYNYTGDTAPTLRTVKFAFNRYNINNDLPKFDEYISQNVDEVFPKPGLGFISQDQNSDVVRVSKPLTDDLRNTTLGAKVLATKPVNSSGGVFDKFNDMVTSKLNGYARQGVGMAQTAINNTLNAVENTTVSWLVKGEQIVAKPLNTAVEGLNVAVTGALEKLSPNGRNDDTTGHAQNGIGRELGNPSYTNTNIVIPKNDTANVSTVGFDPNNPYKPVFTDAKDAVGIDGVKPNAPLSYIAKPNPPIDDARHGGILVGGISVDKNDTPTGLQDLQNLLPNPPDNDHLIGKEQVGNIVPNPFKDSEPSKTIKFIYISTPTDDVLRGK